MSLACGIVGLPNVGKSTLFNALTHAGAEAQNYPFCTIEPNVGIVEVPDDRLEVIHGFIETEQVIPAALRIVDIAGLVAGASKGEGLGNTFLSHIREVDAIVEVVRCFEDDNVVHVAGRVNPLDDVGVIETELALADLETLERAIEKNVRKVRGQDKLAAAETRTYEKARAVLDDGRPLRAAEWTGEEHGHLHRLFPLTMKKVLYVANVDADDLQGESDAVAALREHARSSGSDVVVLCADIESELATMEPDDKREFLADLGLAEPGLERLAHAAFELLGLMTFYTAGPKEIRAWTIRRGATGPKAAGVIHSDFEKHYIRAEVYSVDDLVELGSEQVIRAKGRMRSEGRDYVMRDGDVAHFLVGK